MWKATALIALSVILATVILLFWIRSRPLDVLSGQALTVRFSKRLWSAQLGEPLYKELRLLRVENGRAYFRDENGLFRKQNLDGEWEARLQASPPAEDLLLKQEGGPEFSVPVSEISAVLWHKLRIWGSGRANP